MLNEILFIIGVIAIGLLALLSCIYASKQSDLNRSTLETLIMIFTIVCLLTLYAIMYAPDADHLREVQQAVLMRQTAERLLFEQTKRERAAKIDELIEKIASKILK